MGVGVVGPIRTEWDHRRRPMTYAADVPRNRRAATLAAVMGAHVGIILLIVAARHPPIVQVKPQSVTVLSLAHEQTAAAPPPSLPSKRPPERRVIAAPSVSTMPEASVTEASSSGCSTLEEVSKAIVADPAAVAAVVQAPTDTRSVADAIVIWNAGWSEPTEAVDGPLEPVRRVVVQNLSGLDEQCLDEPIVGPRFIPVPQGDRTLFLVFGSGAWNWKQLVETDDGASTAPSDAMAAGH